MERILSKAHAFIGIKFRDFCGGTDGSQRKPAEVRTRLHPGTSPTSLIVLCQRKLKNVKRSVKS